MTDDGRHDQVHTSSVSLHNNTQQGDEEGHIKRCVAACAYPELQLEL